MEIEYRLCQKTYKFKSYQAKFIHYSMSVKWECLYVAETIASKGLTEIEKDKRKFLRKIMRPRKVLAN